MQSNHQKIRSWYAKRIYKIIGGDAEMKRFSIELEKNILLSAKNMCKKSGYLVYTQSDDNKYTAIFYKFYEGLMRTVLNNLDKNSYVKNTDLIDKVTNNILTPKNIVQMATECPQSLCPEKHQEIFNDIEKQEDARYNSISIPISSEYTCKKCKSNRCIVNLAQLRSADESMSTLITCIDCGNKWRFG